MSARGWLIASAAAGGLALAHVSPARAVEYTFSTYGLGGTAFGAGVTPPPGTYLSAAFSHYKGDINGNINFGGVVFNAGAEAEMFAASVNGLFVPEWTVHGGRLGIAVTVPVAHVGLEATVSALGLSTTRETDGSGLGDIVTRVQLGWQHGDFSHLFWVQAAAPTGKYEPGFFPIVGLNRPSIDTGWAFTWTDRRSKLQFNGAFGFNFNFENDETDYLSGNEFHFEWAIGYELAPGLIVGIVGYDWRQLTGDSGAGALLGPFEGSVDAIGPGLSYTTLVGATPLIINMRHYEEFSAERRISGSVSIFTGTMKF